MLHVDSHERSVMARYEDDNKNGTQSYDSMKCCWDYEASFWKLCEFLEALRVVSIRGFSMINGLGPSYGLVPVRLSLPVSR